MMKMQQTNTNNTDIIQKTSEDLWVRKKDSYSAEMLFKLGWCFGKSF